MSRKSLRRRRRSSSSSSSNSGDGPQYCPFPKFCTKSMKYKIVMASAASLVIFQLCLLFEVQISFQYVLDVSHKPIPDILPEITPLKRSSSKQYPRIIKVIYDNESKEEDASYWLSSSNINIYNNSSHYYIHDVIVFKQNHPTYTRVTWYNSTTSLLQPLDPSLPRLDEAVKGTEFYMGDQTEPEDNFFSQRIFPPCLPQYDWQVKSINPTCNHFHEESFLHSITETTTTTNDDHAPKLSFVASGGFRDVWKILDNYNEHDPNWKTSAIALKTLGTLREYYHVHYDRHRIDAVINGRLNHSPYIASIYGACGNSAFVEFAPGGTLRDIIQEKPKSHPIPEISKFNTTEKLILAYQVVSAIYDIQYKAASSREGTAKRKYEGKTLPSIAHTDIKPEQFVYSEKQRILKISDFNRCRMIPYDPRTNRTCDFTIAGGGGKFRSPEEYQNKLQNERTDAYQLGNILYSIYTEVFPWYDMSDLDAKQLTIDGKRPPLDIIGKKHSSSSTDRNNENVLLHAINITTTYDIEDRANIYTVRKYLYTEMMKLGILHSEQNINYVPKIYYNNGQN